MARRSTREQWRARVEAWEDSGLTQREFAAEHDLNASTLSWWKWKLSTLDGSGSEQLSPDVGAEGTTDAQKQSVGDVDVQFVELDPVVADTPVEESSSRIEVVVDSYSVWVPDGFEAATLKRIVDVLEVC